MNKIYNIWILIISIITLPIAFFAGMNQEFGAWNIILTDYEYIDLAFGIAAGLIFLLGASRSAKKWTGLRIVNKKEKFIYNAVIGKERIKRTRVLNYIEIFYFFILAIGFTVFSVKAASVSLVFFILIIDATLYSVIGIWGKKYRIGMTSKAIVSVDREVIAIYFKGLKTITYKSDNLIFEYVNDLVLDLPIENVRVEDRAHFFELLKEKIDREKVFLIGM